MTVSSADYVPIKGRKYVPSQGLAQRKNISLNQVVNFSEENFDRWKKGTDFSMLQQKYHIPKHRAQRILKRGVQKQVLFTHKRTIPQLYYPVSRHYDVIEYLEKGPKETTGTSQTLSPLSNALEHQKGANFLQVLASSGWKPLGIHKIQVEMTLEKDCYSLISRPEWKGNRGRALEEIIDNTCTQYIFYKNGTVTIYVTCNAKPFKIETEDDLAILWAFFGQVRYRLEYEVSDPRGRIVPAVPKWTLKQCDLNKDLQIVDRAQITLPCIQLSTAFQTFRLYVKSLEGKAHYRCEDSRRVNQPLMTYLSSLINPENKILNRLDELSKEISLIKNKLAQP